ncbi:hypothetical protein E4T56_gene16829 [Termitomyces sp. T112]|nr:hypothetical protein E4T56_gene16829 [Termitomyces sp. T112]
MQPLSKPIPVYNINGTPNEAGAINSVVDLVLHYQNYAECTVFAITSLGRQDMILGFTWLQEHNSKCSACAVEDRAEHQTQVREHAAIHTCHTGPLLFADLDLLDPLPLAFPHREALYEDNWSNSRALEEEHGEEFGGICKLELPDEVVEVGDQIYATTIHPLPSVAEIQASQTTSQWLAQAFAAKAMPQEFWDVVPPYPHAFKDVFSKASFDLLPECKRWYHTIKLLPDSAPSSCKVYPLVLWEQDELDAFLQENLDSGHIHPSKSLMASPVFFIKKKDGSLWLVQDYCVLNAMMAWWSLYLANFNFSLHHKPGWSMGRPDTLSQRADHSIREGDNSNIVLLYPELFAIQAIKGIAVEGAEADIFQDIWWGNWDGQQEELVARAAQTLKLGHTTGAKAVCTDE